MRRTSDRPLISVLLSLMLLIQCLSIQTLAQTATTTSISGLVSDAQGAVVPKANVALMDKAKGQERTATTNDEGRYVFSNLEAGVY